MQLHTSATPQESESKTSSSPSLSALAWTPKGIPGLPMSKACQATTVDQIISSAKNDLELQSRLEANHAKCERSIQQQEYLSIGSMAKYYALSYQLKKNPAIKQGLFQLHDGRQVPAVFAIKNGSRKRPLVIAKCGIYCDAADGAVAANIFMHLFEESPFNVVMLASSSGKQAAKLNQLSSVSGADEGAQLFESAMILAKYWPALMQVTSDIHYVGFSLGGQAALFAGIYSSLYRETLQQAGVPHVGSTISVCPVVDLPAQVEAVANSKIRTAIFNRFAGDIFNSPQLNAELKGERSNLLGHASRATLNYFTQDASSTPLFARLLAPLAHLIGRTDNFNPIADAASFGFSNQVQNWAQLNTVPTLVLHSSDDELVPSSINSRRLTSKNLAGSKYISIEMSRGGHCAISLATDWRYISQMMRSFVSKNSAHDESLLQPTQVDLTEEISSWSWNQRLNISNGEVISDIFWNIEPNAKQASLTFKIFSASFRIVNSTEGENCERMKSGEANFQCYRTVTGAIPLSALQALGIKSQNISNIEAASRVSRFLNTRTHFKTQDGKLALGLGRSDLVLTSAGRFE
jgi:pimeloyl-ACP methyl ester carboxylesterase